jgi:hypothetical protein
MRSLLLVALVGGLAAPAVDAQMRPKSEILEQRQKQKDKENKNKNKDKQLKQQRNAEILERLLDASPQQREDMLAGMIPERREQMLRRLEEFDAMPADERRLLRSRFQFFMSLPAGRREALRREIRELRRLSRPEIRRRMASPEIRDNFYPEEIQLLYEVTSQEQ